MHQLRKRIRKQTSQRAQLPPLSPPLLRLPKQPSNITDPPIDSSDSEAEEKSSGLIEVLNASVGGRQPSANTSHGSALDSMLPSTPPTPAPAPAAAPQKPRHSDSLIQLRRSARISRKRGQNEVENDDADSQQEETEAPASRVGGRLMFEPSALRPKKIIFPGYGKKAQARRLRESKSRRQYPQKKTKNNHHSYHHNRPHHLSPLEDNDSSGLSDPPSSLPSDLEDYIKTTYTKTSNRLSPSTISQQDDPKDTSLEPADLIGPKGLEELFHPHFKPLDLDESETSELRQSDPNMAFCPMCEEPVDKAWLDGFSQGQRMPFRRQSEFCTLHKKKDAENTSVEKGYPYPIDWDHLNQRIGSTQKRSYIESLIRGEAVHSYFGALFQEEIHTGRNKTLRKTKNLQDFIPGYYGLCGMDLITQRLTEIHMGLLRERLPLDELVSARGPVIFVQFVLCPQLSLKLIQEDMSLNNEAKAIKVIKESRSIGEVLAGDNDNIDGI